MSSSVNCGSAGNCSVTSDSTITGLTFIGNTIHFIASGPPGTTAFANITVPKSAIQNVNQVSVSVDNTPLANSAFSVTARGSLYLVYFKFTFHSTVDIALNLQSNTQASPLIAPEIMYGLIIVAAIIAGSALVVLRKKGKSTTAN
jgi:hypothetical protein